MHTPSKTIAILGAGLVGSVLAMYLARRGYQVDLFERHPDPCQHQLAGQRASISLTLCQRGLSVLDDLDVGESVRRLTVPVYGRRVHTPGGLGPFQPYGNNDEALYAVSRNALNRALLQHTERFPTIRRHYGQKCVGLDLASTTLRLQDTQTGALSAHQPDLLFAADGAFSIVRHHLERLDRFNYSQCYLDHGYCELTIPSAAPGRPAFDRNELHLWPRRQYLLLGFANLDDSITVSLFMPFAGARSFEALRSPADVRQLFEESFPDVLPYLPHPEQAFFAKPPNSMVTIQCTPWVYGGRVALIGDAAHSIVPYYGQGANAGFEDCLALDRCLDRHGDDWPSVLAEYQQLRKPNTDLIGDLAAQHFNELCDRVNDPRFLLRKQIERKVNYLHPDSYTPLYSMIAFSSRPYVEAMRIERRQRGLIDQLMALDRIDERWDSPEVEQQIHQMVGELRGERDGAPWEAAATLAAPASGG